MLRVTGVLLTVSIRHHYDEELITIHRWARAELVRLNGINHSIGRSVLSLAMEKDI